MKDVVVPITVGILDVVSQAVAKGDAIATQNNYALLAVSPLPEFNVQATWELLFFRELVIKEARVDAAGGPAALNLAYVVLGCLAEFHVHLASCSGKRRPHPAQQPLHVAPLRLAGALPPRRQAPRLPGGPVIIPRPACARIRVPTAATRMLCADAG